MADSNGHSVDAVIGAQPTGSSSMTTEERSVLALERIADELTLFNQTLEQFLDLRGARRGGDLGTLKSL